MYIRSSIILQPSGLYRASIITSWLYFGEQEIHASFKTLGEARDWLIAERCENLEQKVEKPTIEELFKESKISKVSYADKLKGK